MDPRFIAYWAESKPYWAQIEAGKIISTIDNFSASRYRNLELVAPRHEEQRAIADFLDAETDRIDALISKRQQLVHAVERRWIAALIESVDPGPDAAPPRLRRALRSSMGGSWGAEPGTAEIDAACIRGTDFDTRRLSVKPDSAPTRSYTRSEFDGRRLVPGDLIIEKSGGGDAQPVGRVVLWGGGGAAVPTNFAARLRPAEGVSSRFLAYVFQSACARGLTRAWIKQTTGIQNLDLGGLLSERWRLPNDRAEQNRIVADLEASSRDTLQVQERMQRQIALLRERRQALITAAVTGELAIPGVAA